MKTRLLRKVRKRVGYRYRILTRKNTSKYQIWGWGHQEIGWKDYPRHVFWSRYRYEVISEAKKILGDGIFKIKRLG